MDTIELLLRAITFVVNNAPSTVNTDSINLLKQAIIKHRDDEITRRQAEQAAIGQPH
jgi:hypothetical protein